MKKALLFLSSMLVGVAAFAQEFTVVWPSSPVPEFMDFAVEQECYLWNVGAGGFYINHQGSGGPYWGTRATVNTSLGTKVKFTQTNPGGINETSAFETEPNAYLLVSYVTSKKANMCTFSDAWDGIWTDNNSNANRYFDIVPSGGYIKIQPNVELQDGKSDGMFLGVRGEDPNMLIYLYDKTPGRISETEPFYDKWAAVSTDAYDAWYAARNGEEGQKVYACYVASESLKAEILTAQEKGVFASRLADYYAVYNNLESTVEELNAAKQAVWEIWRWDEIKNLFDESNITVGEANDVSDAFINNDFDEGDATNMAAKNTRGWDITFQSGVNAENIGYNYNMGTVEITHPVTGEKVQGLINTYELPEGGEETAFLSKFIEAWRPAANPLGEGSITQTIPNLPKGKYVLAVDANACNQDNGNDVDNVQLFARASLTGQEYFTTVSTPDENNRPRHFEFNFIHAGGSMTLGFRVTDKEKANNPANWIAMDNLKLYFYGDEGMDPDQYQLGLLIEDLKGKQDPDDLESVAAYAGAKTDYETAMGAAELIYENGGDFVQAQTDLQTAYDALVASIADYKNFASFLEQADERVLDFEGTAFETSVGSPLSDQVGLWHDAYDDEEYTKETIDGLASALAKAVADLFPTTLNKGDDLTAFIANAGFDRGFYGWTSVDATPVWGGTIMEKDGEGNVTYKTSNTVEGCEPIESGCAEVFQKAFSMSQTYKGLPAGVYQLRAQIFERNDNNKTDGETFLYAMVGDKEQKQVAPFIDKYATDERLFVLNEEAWETDIETTGGSGKYIPRSMEGANYHFAHTTEGNELPDYTVTLNIVLDKVSDVEFGVKNTSGGDWVIFDNFQLIYLGEDLSVYLIPVNDKLSELSQFIEENEDNVGTTDVKDGFETLTSGVAKLQTKEDCAAYIKTIEDAIAYAKNSVKFYAEADDLVSQLENAKDEVDANPTAADDTNTYLEEVSDPISSRELTVADLEEVIAKCKVLLTALLLPENFNSATDENGIDITKVIVNPSFEENMTGWTNSGTIAAWEQTNKLFDNQQGDIYCECYHKDGTIDVNQTIAALPAGTYELNAAISSQATDCKLYANDAAYDVPANASGRYSVIFELEETSDVTFGISWTDKGGFWNALDDFKLTYYGTESQKVDVEEISVPVANEDAPLYNLAGQRVNKSYKGYVVKKGQTYYNNK